MITINTGREISWIGVALSILLIGGGIYLGIKHHASPGFWFGVLALLLITLAL